MNKKPKYILICFCFISYFVQSQINENTTNIIVENFEKLVDNKTQEIVYLQTSKGVYETQENVWFKGYVLDARLLSPSKNSKTLFVQLIEDKTNKAVWEEKYEIEGGFVNGHLYLNDSLQTGSYNLVAYTSHSFYKDSKEFHAIRKLQILKNIKSKPKSIFSKKDSILNFKTFPEGGDLVSGIQNRIAFKAESSKGLPIEVSGVLYENNKPIVEFKSTYAGMGKFLFIPNSKNKYHIKLTKPQKNKIYYLPQILPKGKTLQLLTNTENYATFKITQTANLTKETIFLRVQIRGVVYSVAMGTLNKELFIKIPLKDIPQGIAEVTLLNENLAPIAERLIYVNPDRTLNIKTILNKSEYVTREKVTLKLKVTDENEQPIVAHLGLSIYDILYQNKENSKNILAHYYLSTQLNGNIYNPAYYFNKDNKNRHEALNLLLLTQGWRRYVWNEGNLREHNKHVQPLISDSIIGRIRLDRKLNKPEVDAQKIVMAYTPNPLKNKDFIIADAKGIFSISDKHLKMSEKGYLYIKPMMPKYVVHIKDNSFDIINVNRKKAPINHVLQKKGIEEEMDSTNFDFSQLDKTNKLDRVVLSVKKKQAFRDKYFGTLDSLAKLSTADYVCRSGFLNCINHRDDFENKPIEGVSYVNENRIGKSTYWFKKYSEKELLRKFNLKMIKGYYGKREFYQPIYNEETLNDPFDDYRNTLFWKPDIITNAQGEAIIEFYCSDINTNFLGTIEGVSYDGLIGTGNFNFKVQIRK